MHSQLSYILYLSRRRASTSNEDVARMLKDAQSFNDRHAVTGLLVCGNHWFLQHLEGREVDIEKAYRRILNSSLHDDVTQLAGGMLLGREFPTWSMAGLGNAQLDDTMAEIGLEPSPNKVLPTDRIKLVKVLAAARGILMAAGGIDAAAPVVFLD